MSAEAVPLDFVTENVQQVSNESEIHKWPLRSCTEVDFIDLREGLVIACVWNNFRTKFLVYWLVKEEISKACSDEFRYLHIGCP